MQMLTECSRLRRLGTNRKPKAFPRHFQNAQGLHDTMQQGDKVIVADPHDAPKDMQCCRHGKTERRDASSLSEQTRSHVTT
jgi:hypothetical protein